MQQLMALLLSFLLCLSWCCLSFGLVTVSIHCFLYFNAFRELGGRGEGGRREGELLFFFLLQFHISITDKYLQPCRFWKNSYDPWLNHNFEIIFIQNCFSLPSFPSIINGIHLAPNCNSENRIRCDWYSKWWGDFVSWCYTYYWHCC